MFEFQTYDLVVLDCGTVGVVLPHPESASWMLFFDESLWDHIDTSRMHVGSTRKIHSVHRGDYGDKLGIACSLGYNDRRRVNSVSGVRAVWKRKPAIKLGDYEAKISDDGSIKVGCQTVTREQLAAFLEEYNSREYK